jgi:hypothetical protein
MPIVTPLLSAEKNGKGTGLIKQAEAKIAKHATKPLPNTQRKNLTLFVICK